MDETYTPPTQEENDDLTTPLEIQEGVAAKQAETDEFVSQVVENARRISGEVKELQAPLNTVRNVSLGAAAAGALALAVSPVVGEAVDTHITNYENQNTQYVEDAKQSEERQAFEQGLEDNKVKIDVSNPPTVTELPTPETH